MARTDKTFKLSYNSALALCRDGKIPETIRGLAISLGVSRTTARKVLNRLLEQKFLVRTQDGFQTGRRVQGGDFYSPELTRPTRANVETRFFHWLLDERIERGSRIREADVAREIDSPVAVLHQILESFSRFGFVTRQPKRHWIYNGITRELADALFDFRFYCELRAMDKLPELPDTSEFWQELEAMRQQHLDYLRAPDHERNTIAEMDARFHRLLLRYSGGILLLVNEAALSLIFYYRFHESWREYETAQRRVVVGDHLEIIDALEARNTGIAKSVMRRHLNHAWKSVMKRFEA